MVDLRTGPRLDLQTIPIEPLITRDPNLAAILMLFGKKMVLVPSRIRASWFDFSFPDEPYEEMLQLQQQILGDPNVLISSAKFLVAVRQIRGLVDRKLHQRPNVVTPETEK